MALQIRRGTEAQRVAMDPPLVRGELAYVTNYESEEVSPLWIGDGNTPGGIPVAPVLTVNSYSGTVQLYTDDITEGDTPTNLWFQDDRAQDAAAALFTETTTSSTNHSGITFAYNDAAGKIVATVDTTVNYGTANSLAYYGSNGSVVSGSSSNLTWNNTTSFLSIDNSTVGIYAGNGPRTVFNLSTSYNGTFGNGLTIERSRGTKLSPTTLVNGDTLGNVHFAGHDGTSYTQVARLSAFVNGTVSTGVIPTGMGLSTTSSGGETRMNLRILDTGQVIIGPGTSGEPGSGQLFVFSTTNPPTAQYANSVVNITTVFDGQDGQNITFARARGTRATPTAIVSGDDVIDLSFLGLDSVGAYVPAAVVTIGAEGTIAAGKVPGNMVFRLTNTNGVATQVLKLSAPSTSTTVGTVQISGTISTTSTPATFWNYDTSGSTLTLTLGQTVDFSNFSGSVLVNCHNSGTVTQYLCGGGGAPIAVGSSKVTSTGTMSSNGGINGYTFTSTEAGVHSFYVIRTRTDA